MEAFDKYNIPNNHQIYEHDITIIFLNLFKVVYLILLV